MTVKWSYDIYMCELKSIYVRKCGLNNGVYLAEYATFLSNHDIFHLHSFVSTTTNEGLNRYPFWLEIYLVSAIQLFLYNFVYTELWLLQNATNIMGYVARDMEVCFSRKTVFVNNVTRKRMKGFSCNSSLHMRLGTNRNIFGMLQLTHWIQDQCFLFPWSVFLSNVLGKRANGFSWNLNEMSGTYK